MGNRGFKGTLVGVISGVAIGVLASAPAALAHARIHGIKHKLTATTSTNWSGYTVDGTNATSVSGTWTVQAAQCAAKETSWSSPWVGIDGDTDATVEQTGTDTDCNSGVASYYAWWEMYPKSTVVINHPVSPGDVMTGSVVYGSSGFVLSLNDTTAGWSFQTAQSSNKAKRLSVEWIVEGPSSGTLTNFGTLPFSSATATIGGQNSSLDGFGSKANAITMTTKSGVDRAVPGPVGKNGGFSVNWLHG